MMTMTSEYWFDINSYLDRATWPWTLIVETQKQSHTRLPPDLEIGLKSVGTHGNTVLRPAISAVRYSHASKSSFPWKCTFPNWKQFCPWERKFSNELINKGACCKIERGPQIFTRGPGIFTASTTLKLRFNSCSRSSSLTNLVTFGSVIFHLRHTKTCKGANRQLVSVFQSVDVDNCHPANLLV